MTLSDEADAVNQLQVTQNRHPDRWTDAAAAQTRYG